MAAMSMNIWPVLLVLLLAAGGARGAGVEARDDLGQVVFLQRPAQRIVSLAPHVTELLFAAGAGGRVVGAVESSDYPPAARRIRRVGGAAALDLEAIVALRPQLVVAWDTGNPSAPIERLRALGYPVYVSEPRALEDIGRTLRRLGRLAGTEAQARTAAAAYERRLQALRNRYAGRAPLSVFYQVWDRPLITVNGEHLISAVLELCGGRNVFADLPALAPQVSLEAVLARQPEVIVMAPAPEVADTWRVGWRRWSGLPAVQADSLFVIDPDLLHRQGPRVLEGAERLCRVLQKARVRKAQAR